MFRSFVRNPADSMTYDCRSLSIGSFSCQAPAGIEIAEAGLEYASCASILRDINQHNRAHAVKL